jgi:cbb3-type cytochrome oxidase maturation protein
VSILVLLVPTALLLGLVGLGGFFWALRHHQFDDPAGHAARILAPDYDHHPAGEDGREG